MTSADSSRTIIKGPADYPYGAFGESYTRSTNGYPPLLNPAIGTLFEPTDPDDYMIYTALAGKLEKAIIAAVPEGTGPILMLQLRSPSLNVKIASMYLCCAAFVLGEVDPGHPLLKIATLTDFNEFRAAVEALE